MIDLLYTIGIGSRWDDHELRFGLRSVFKNLIGFRNIFIVGYLPPFLNVVARLAKPIPVATSNSQTHQLIHLPCDDPYSCPDSNMIRKILTACSDPRVSNTFLYIHDDHFIIKPTKITAIKNYYKGYLETDARSTNPMHILYNTLYSEQLRNTWHFLKKHNYPTYHFDGHCPILINRHKFLKIFAIPKPQSQTPLFQTGSTNLMSLNRFTLTLPD